MAMTATTGSTGELMRGTPARRYWAFGAVLFSFVIAVFLSFQALFEQKRIIEQDSRVNLWFLAQTEIEYLNLMEALSPTVATQQGFDHERLVERFELFWSRLPILMSGSQSERLRAVPGLTKTIGDFIRTLEELEPELADPKTLTAEKLTSIYHRLDALRTPLHDLLQRGVTFDYDATTGDRREQEYVYYQLLTLFIGIMLGGLMLLFMLYREIVRANRSYLLAREAEREAERAKGQLVDAIASISEGFVLYDEEDRVALFNERYKDLHPPIAPIMRVGISFEDMLREAVQRGGIKIPAENVDRWIADIVTQHLNPGAPFESRLSDGRWLRISERRMSNGRIVGIHTDITELKQREAELTQQTALLQATLDNITQGVCVFDAQQRAITWNERFVELLELPPDFALAGAAYRDFVRLLAERGEFGHGRVEESVASHLRFIEQALEEGGGSGRMERRRPDGTVIEVTVNAMPDGGFIKTYTDVTERVQAEAERTNLLDQFYASQKMQAIGTLAGGIAHDFNNILGSILGYAHLALEDLAADHPARDSVEQVATAGVRAKNLVQQILTFSRRTETPFSPVDLSALVDEALTLMRSTLPVTIAIQKDRWDAGHVFGNATQIHQVILNLCVNAAQAIGDRPGTIRLGVEQVEDAAAHLPVHAGRLADQTWSRIEEVDGRYRMTFGALAGGRHVRLTVRDSGSGMPPTVMARMFEPFFTTKAVKEGTGLGLAAVQGILQQHRAAIAVESAPGWGTRIEVFLPLVESVSEGDSVAAAPAPARADERILVIDDDRTLLEMTRTTLERQGYRVTAVRDPLDAVLAFAAAPDEWDLVITDRTMPRMNGEDVAREILRSRPETPVIMCTGFSDAVAEEKARSIGIRAFLMKPIVGKELTATVRSVLDGAKRVAAE
jgi:signal transduction histidine kinase/ActR/RegA family two-component response regulator